VAWTDANPWRPFCSTRCKGIDLGDWAGNRFVIAGEPVGTAADDAGPAVTPRS
jgi:hypothetical protein